MTTRALVLETCLRLGLRDPAELAALPGDLPDLWVEHTRQDITGGYNKASKPQGSR